MRSYLRRALWPIIYWMMRIAGINPLTFAHRQMGMMDADISKNGEEKLLKELGPISSSNWQILDVGANVGLYSRLLRTHFPSAEIHSFEPNPASYKSLKEVMGIHAHNIGMGSAKAELPLFTPGAAKSGAHSSLIEESLIEEKTQHVQTVQVDTLKSICKNLDIEKIDFLKIDVEGFEIEVLKGAEDMLEKVRFLQFEFNHHLIYSRHYLKDFYDLLPYFTFYRVTPRGLKPMHAYNPVNEIFQMQNILAINMETVAQEEIRQLTILRS